MSYIKTAETYAYPDGDGGVVLHTNQVVDQGRDHEPFRYLVRLSGEEFREFVREVVTRTAPSWVKPQMIEDAVQKFVESEKI